VPSTHAQTAAEIEDWFDDHGLPYFSGDHADRIEKWLSRKRITAVIVLIVAASIAVGVAVGVLAADPKWGPVAGIAMLLASLGLFAGRLLRMGTMFRWAVRRTFGSLGLMFPLLTRALPLLLLAVTFLFINAEVWQVSATLDGGVLWVTVLLFSFIALAFLLTRLPEELDHVDDEADESSVVEVCRNTPLAAYAQSVLDADDSVERLAERTKVHGLEKANLLLVLIVTQALQVLLLSVSVFAFFVVFGAVIMKHGVQEAWTASTIHALPYATNLSVELLQVSVFLAAFSGLYFTVYAVTDETYRDQFFTEIKAELEKAVGVRAVYLAARGDVDTSATEPQA